MTLPPKVTKWTSGDEMLEVTTPARPTDDRATQCARHDELVAVFQSDDAYPPTD